MVNAARYPARDFGFIIAIANDLTNKDRNENLGWVYFPASIKPLIPI
jgi:hypothetical protein